MVYLFERYMGQSITASEEQEWAVLVLLPANEKLLEALEQQYWNKELPSPLTRPETEIYLARFFKPRPGNIRVIAWKRIAVAACILIAIGLGSYMAFFSKPHSLPHTVNTAKIPGDIKAPANNRAMITLADGSTVFLDSATNGNLAMQGNIKVVKLANGQIAYDLSAVQAGAASGKIVKELQYNTLTNPRGSQVINMRLSDGSHVWLNAGSSITYPVAFVLNERKVSITGEAYFEIAHDNAKSFKVTKGDMTVEVLGTHFNVNAYDDEPEIKVTLLEGAVKVSTRDDSRQIQPGQQATIHHSSFVIHHSVDTEQAIAWKNGLFAFDGVGIQEVMRQLARWYNLEVSYNGEPAKRKFRGKISKGLTLAQVLNGLSATRIQYKLEGNKITIIKE